MTKRKKDVIISLSAEEYLLYSAEVCMICRHSCGVELCSSSEPLEFDEDGMTLQRCDPDDDEDGWVSLDDTSWCCGGIFVTMIILNISRVTRRLSDYVGWDALRSLPAAGALQDYYRLVRHS